MMVYTLEPVHLHKMNSPTTHLISVLHVGESLGPSLKVLHQSDLLQLPALQHGREGVWSAGVVNCSTTGGMCGILV